MQIALQHLLADRHRLGRRQAGIDAQIVEGVEQPVDMLLQPEGLMGEGAGGIEDRIAEEEAAVAEGDQHLALRQDPPVVIGDAFVLSRVAHVSRP